jgi:hypothetical protein
LFLRFDEEVPVRVRHHNPCLSSYFRHNQDFVDQCG